MNVCIYFRDTRSPGVRQTYATRLYHFFFANLMCIYWYLLMVLIYISDKQCGRTHFYT